MPLEFTADQFEAVEEEWGLVTRLSAPSTEDEDPYLMLQRASDFDEQDIALGMDKPYIEFYGQGWSWYGHVERFDLFRDHIRVKMDQAAADEMENDGVVMVHLHLDETRFGELRKCLERTFEGFPVAHTHV